MNITYESHRPFAVQITPQDEKYIVVTKFKLNCGLVVNHSIPLTVDTKDEDIAQLLKKMFQCPCYFEVRRCGQGIIASAIYFEEDQTRQYVRGTSPIEIMREGFRIHEGFI